MKKRKLNPKVDSASTVGVSVAMRQHLRADQDPREQLEHDARHLAAGRFGEQRRDGRDRRDQRDGREGLGVHRAVDAIRTSRASGSGSARDRSPAHHPAGAGAGVVAVALDDLPVHDRRDVAVGALQDALRARGKVVDDLDRDAV